MSSIRNSSNLPDNQLQSTVMMIGANVALLTKDFSDNGIPSKRASTELKSASAERNRVNNDVQAIGQVLINPLKLGGT